MPDVPLTLKTLQIISPYAFTLAAVGLLESLMTAVIIDDMTDTSSNKNQECYGQGLGNVVAGMFGGMAGCAMIGQSVINVSSGGRSRLSSLVAGSFLMVLILLLDDYVKQIPMAALVAVMIMVSISTFKWSSVFNFKSTPITSHIVMISTVSIVVLTHNLALGVLVGVLICTFFFAKDISHMLDVKSEITTTRCHKIYRIHGQIFFASAGEHSTGQAPWYLR